MWAVNWSCAYLLEIHFKTHLSRLNNDACLLLWHPILIIIPERLAAGLLLPVIKLFVDRNWSNFSPIQWYCCIYSTLWLKKCRKRPISEGFLLVLSLWYPLRNVFDSPLIISIHPYPIRNLILNDLLGGRGWWLVKGALVRGPFLISPITQII